ncbi:tRNA (adenosine(37)-N6)-threonylcarbamoyltransferase complex transferase subunit TsaD [bacterium]|nr:tRNA (adenosine(37)-N6)-threonylcarbamoyltransferase complex transferase subunit TsaD [bacterium]
MLVLGIESSCDETGIAIVEDGKKILSNSIEFQDEIHKDFGGVVPEFAARHHAEKIGYLLDLSLKKANLSLKDIDIIAATNGPGLIGSLLVGYLFARGLSYGLKIPLIPVNHILAHLYMANMIFPNEIEYPHYAVLLSGGHTFILKAKNYLDFEILAKTRDDAIGEAFDKIAHYFNLGYPGGKIIDDIALKGNAKKIIFPMPNFKEKTNDFSYSGLKTAVLNHIKSIDDIKEAEINDILASFQKRAFDIIFRSLKNIVRSEHLGQVIFGGGVAANNYLRRNIKGIEEELNIKTYFPPKKYCTDNGVMIAGIGYHLFKAGKIFEGEDVFSRADYRKLY